MFRSFFPMPKIFFPAALVWIIFVTIIWFWIGNDIASPLGLASEEAEDMMVAEALARVHPSTCRPVDVSARRRVNASMC